MVNREGSVIWWTRSRNWAVLAAFSFVGIPAFVRDFGGILESRGDSLYLPLPLARAIAFTGPSSPGPIVRDDGSVAYRYTLATDAERDDILNTLWPGTVDTQRFEATNSTNLNSIIRRGTGPMIPLPARLRNTLITLIGRDESQVPKFVPVSTLGQLYAETSPNRKESK